MEMITSGLKQPMFQQVSLQDQLDLISDCLLMAGAIKRHNEDAAMVTGDQHAAALAEEMFVIIEGAGSLLEGVNNQSYLTPLEFDELKMVWNRLHYMVTLTYQGSYFSVQSCN